LLASYKTEEKEAEPKDKENNSPEEIVNKYFDEGGEKKSLEKEEATERITDMLDSLNQ